MRRWIAPALMLPLAAHAQTVTLDSLLEEMTDRAAIARWPEPAYTCAQASSYDRASTSPADPEGWFANRDVDQFLREERTGDRTEYVMLDATGPGAVVRVWSANPPEGAVLRFYLDGREKPEIEADMRALLGGDHAFGGARLGEPLAGVRSKGWNLYLPIPYAAHCKITCDKRGFYYQVNYRTYAPGTKVASFRAAAVDARAVGAANAELRKPGGADWVPAHDPVMLDPGTRATAWVDTVGPRAIDDLAIAFGGAPERAAGVVVEMSFDGEPCVWVPLPDFVGCGGGLTAFHDRYRSVLASGLTRSHWVMPYQRRAELVLHNVGDKPVRVGAMVRTREWAWDDRSMHFHASWRREYPIHAAQARGTMDWNYIEIAGKGVYAGDNLTVVNPVPAWWGEGDEKVYVDGEAFPSHFGTGTEDYYGYAWCWPEPFQHPFHAQTRADGWAGAGRKWTNWGRTAVTRVRALDAIPFTRSLKFDMEVWHWVESDVAYAGTTYWYAKPGATSNRGASPDEARRVIPDPPPLPRPMTIAGAIECERMKVVAKSDGLGVEVQELEGFAAKTWSGGEHLWVKGESPGAFVELEVPAGGDLPREITLYATKSWDYGVVGFSVNGEAAGGADLWSGEAGKVGATGPIVLGRFTPKDGTFVVRAEVTGSNPGSLGKRHYFGLDCVVLK